MRSALAISGILLALAPWSAGAEQLASHSVLYSAVARGAPQGVRIDATTKTWTLQSCQKWTMWMITSFSMQANRRKIMQRTEIKTDEGVSDFVTQISYRSVGDLGNEQRKFDAIVPTEDARSRIAPERVGTSRRAVLPLETLPPKQATDRLIEELRNGSSKFSIAAVDPMAPGAWSRTDFEVIDKWPYAERPLPQAVVSQLVGRHWYVKLTAAFDKGEETSYMEVYENGIVTRMTLNLAPIVVDLTAAKLVLIEPEGC